MWPSHRYFRPFVSYAFRTHWFNVTKYLSWPLAAIRWLTIIPFALCANYWIHMDLMLSSPRHRVPQMSNYCLILFWLCVCFYLTMFTILNILCSLATPQRQSNKRGHSRCKLESQGADAQTDIHDKYHTKVSLYYQRRRWGTWRDRRGRFCTRFQRKIWWATSSAESGGQESSWC